MTTLQEHAVDQALEFVREHNPLRPINPVRRGGIKPSLASQLVQTLGVPAVVAGWLLYKFVWVKRGKNKTPAAAQPSAAATPSAAKQQAPARSKPRRDYKVKRDHAADEAERQAARAAALQAVQQLANQTEEDHDEGEAEEEEGAAGGPGGQGQFIQMLQSLGYKLVMPSDGSNQVYLVPPGGAEGHGEQQQHSSLEQQQGVQQVDGVQQGSYQTDLQPALTHKGNIAWRQARGMLSNAAIASHEGMAGPRSEYNDGLAAGQADQGQRVDLYGGYDDANRDGEEWEEDDALDFEYDLDAGSMGGYLDEHVQPGMHRTNGGYLLPERGPGAGVHGPSLDLPDFDDFNDEGEWEEEGEGEEDVQALLRGLPPGASMLGDAMDAFDHAIGDEISEHLMNEMMREMMAEGLHAPDYYLEEAGDDMYIEEGDEEGFDEDEDA